MFEIVNTDATDYPTLTRPRPTIERKPTWRAVFASGCWSVVGDINGHSCVLNLNPYRMNRLGDATAAHRIAQSLDEGRRRDAALRLLLSATQMFEEARNNGVDAGADLIEFAEMARESL